MTGTIFHGDCVKVMDEEIPLGSVDLIVTSPPYDDMRDYNGYTFDFRKTAVAMIHALKPGGVCVWVVGDKVNHGSKSLTSFKQGIGFQDEGFTIHDIMIYQKKNTPFPRSNSYTNCYEFMFVLSNGKPKTFNPIMEKTARSGTELVPYNKRSDGINHKRPVELKKEKVRNNIWEYAVGGASSTRDKYAYEHPAIFPEKLAEDHILSWSNPGDTILDPFCGSGTTCKMAAKHGRRYIGIDVSEDYVRIARRRVHDMEAQVK